uniref:Putative methyltransferase n=1 Tax=viral metagenome TaxID=1070528 RepID=A0A6M3KEU5_9ZZZZ
MRRNSGFSLLEIMLALAMSSFMMAGVYSTYLVQHKTWIAQDGAIEAQQNLRASSFYVETDLLMAGYDPTRKAGAGFIEAKPDRVRFTIDFNGNGIIDDDADNHETIGYCLRDFDGRTGLAKIVKGANGADEYQQVAENIEVLDFAFIDKSDQAIPFDNGSISTEDLSKIRSVQIAIVSRAARGEAGFQNNEIFKNLSGTVISASADNVRRRAVNAQIWCRNMGI